MTRPPERGSDMRVSQTLRDERGSTLIEALVAMVILTVGLLGLAQVFVVGMTHMATSESNLIAREKAREAVESVHTARDTQTITWAQIRNVSDGGVFLNGPQALRQPGIDGLVNTADDVMPLEVIGPGPDRQLGTADDVRAEGFRREIVIQDIPGSPALRRLIVRIAYRFGATIPPCTQTGPGCYVLETFVSSFS